MKTKILLSVLALGFLLSAFGQNTIELTFTAENNEQNVPLDSILIKNLTQGGDTTLYLPDNVLVLYISGIEDELNTKNSFSISQNYPNPFRGKTTVNFYLPEKEEITISIRDILGRNLMQQQNELNPGKHSFTFYSGSEKCYLLTLRGKTTNKTIKMLNASANTIYGGKCKIVYIVNEEYQQELKSAKTKNDFTFHLGDKLQYIGYTTSLNDIIGSDVIADIPQTNVNYQFTIVNGMLCPGIPTIEDIDGNIYRTVLIGSQCWMKENIKVGTMINATEEMTDNASIEKYCYDDDPANCDTYGGLYQWNEMMQYVTEEGVQGICPDDWHLPTDDEWKQLEMYLGMSQSEADANMWRGTDEGEKLKSNNLWYNGNSSNSSGFTALPGGFHNGNGSTGHLSDFGMWWTSSESYMSRPWYRNLRNDYEQVYRYYYDKRIGLSVRCIMD